jgi:hypothetical protein
MDEQKKYSMTRLNYSVSKEEADKEDSGITLA